MDHIVFELSVIIISTAALCFLAEIAKQPLIVAYIIAGFLVGPYGLNIIEANGFFSALSQVGIILLLFLIGLHWKPKYFLQTIKKTYKIALFSSLSLVPIGMAIGWMTNLSPVQTTFLTISLLFSSTVVVLKRMQNEKGIDKEVFEACVGILLIQDVMAVLVLIGINSYMNAGGFVLSEFFTFLIKAIGFVVSAFFIQYYALQHMMHKIADRTDLIFLIGLAWCFLFAELGEMLHLSREIGGFIAGLSFTSLPHKKMETFERKSETIRDFFMILFFFLLGVNLNLDGLENYTAVILITLAVVLILKPAIYSYFSQRHYRSKSKSREIGIRLGQNSEFSIIIALLATSAGQITDEFSVVIELVLFLSIVISNYVVKFTVNKQLKT